MSIEQEFDVRAGIDTRIEVLPKTGLLTEIAFELPGDVERRHANVVVAHAAGHRLAAHVDLGTRQVGIARLLARTR